MKNFEPDKGTSLRHAIIEYKLILNDTYLDWGYLNFNGLKIRMFADSRIEDICEIYDLKCALRNQNNKTKE